MWRNDFDKSGKSSEDGERAQLNFERLFENRFGVKPIRATKKDDMYKHIDYYMEIMGKDRKHKASVDIKSWKHEKENVWIELVSYGKLGWLYGEADYIGFELPTLDGFIMVKRKELVKLVKKECFAYFTRDKKDVLYNMYIRWKGKDYERYDCATLLPRSLLYTIEHWILK